MREVNAVVGNSSSGILEAPSIGVPTVNIGDRQKGRPQASSIINCRPRRTEIALAVRQALAMERRPAENPYGEGRAAERIVSLLLQELPSMTTVSKHFVDLGGDGD
jgi:UDP-N-acetylglucosamine 2-epimerase (non-hydrolysing)/GDP/UDP-N,N'-diacetylbacillosamine 2-epimerase (hydrolysing)